MTSRSCLARKVELLLHQPRSSSPSNLPWSSRHLLESGNRVRDECFAALGKENGLLVNRLSYLLRPRPHLNDAIDDSMLFSTGGSGDDQLLDCLLIDVGLTAALAHNHQLGSVRP